MNTIASPATRHRHSMRRCAVALVALGAMVAVGACSDEQRRAFGEQDTKDSLSRDVTEALADDAFELDGDLECAADLAATGALTTSCRGVGVDGTAVAATYTGTADTDAETCVADFVVTIGDRPSVEQRDVDCFDAR